MAISDFFAKLRTPDAQLLLSSYAQGLSNPNNMGLGAGLAAGGANFQNSLANYKQFALDQKFQQARLDAGERQFALDEKFMQAKYDEIERQREEEERIRKLREESWNSMPKEYQDLMVPYGGMPFWTRGDPVGVAQVMQKVQQQFNPPPPTQPEYYGNQLLKYPDGTYSAMQFGRDGRPIYNRLPGTPMAGFVPEVARQRKEQEAIGADLGDRTVKLPQALSRTSETIRLLNELKTHPGKKYSVGVGGAIENAIPGTSQAGYVALFNQVKGKYSTEAYESLRGGGHITEEERKVVTQGLARLERNMKPSEYDETIDEMTKVLVKGFERQSAGVTVADPKELLKDELEQFGGKTLSDLVGGGGAALGKPDDITEENWNLLNDEEKRQWLTAD